MPLRLRFGGREQMSVITVYSQVRRRCGWPTTGNGTDVRREKRSRTNEHAARLTYASDPVAYVQMPSTFNGNTN